MNSSILFFTHSFSFSCRSTFYINTNIPRCRRRGSWQTQVQCDIACTLPKGLFSLTPFMNHELFFMFYHGFPSSGDGKWSAWKPWSPCSVSCSLGTQSRSRTCTNPPPTFGGKDCMGKSDETKSCNKGPCPGKSPFSLGFIMKIRALGGHLKCIADMWPVQIGED